MTSIYFDCSAGASGDMLLGCAIDALAAGGRTAELDKWRSAMEPLLALQPGSRMELTSVDRSGVTATKVDFYVGDEHADVFCSNDPTKSWCQFTEVVETIERLKVEGSLPPEAAELSLRIFTLLGEAEAIAHNETLETVHFHEVGAFDSLMDVFGFSLLYHTLKPKDVLASPVTTGQGHVKTAHGMLSVPTPAVQEVTRIKQIPLSPRKIEGECLTPTGAAILGAIVQDWRDQPPAFSSSYVGRGAGRRNPADVSNVVSLIVGNEVRV